MKRYLVIAAAALPALAFAQSAIDAQSVSQSDFKGTARFMSMGGAFTALGGDLSTLIQNPAGIGVYRRSEVGVTVDFNFQNTKTSPSYSPDFPSQNSQTKVYCNNFGYIGSTQLSGAMKTFNWGVTYNRAASFDRVYRGYVARTENSLTNYIASFTSGQGIIPGDMEFVNQGSTYNPYFDSDIDWLSILAYNSYLINPTSTDTYRGLYMPGATTGDALYNVREKGGIDEYAISFGGNVENVVYWGVTVGITDLNYIRTTYYSESMEDAYVYSGATDSYAQGNAGFELLNRKYINGSGWNLKAGVIIKPVNELRIGLAVHTPTWYRFNQGYDGEVNYSYFNPQYAENTTNNPFQGNEYTDPASFDWRLSSPWKLMVGLAGVVGSNFIISADYQYEGFNNMKMSTPVYGFDYGYGYGVEFESNDYLNQDIKDYYKGTNTVRLGLEYRVTPQFSVRAGYNYSDTNVKNEAADGMITVFTSGTDPSYSFDKSIQNICFGLGYKYKSWYIDAAYIYTNRESTYHAYTNFESFRAPQSKITDHNSSLVLSTGFKF